MLTVVTVTGCALPPQNISPGHIQERTHPPSSPPPLVRSLTPPTINPADRKRIETYSVVVKDVDIRDLLFSLARDAKRDIDISPDVSGSVTINAVNQSLPQILDRLSANFDMSYEIVDGVYRITRDKPVLRSYRVEYPNISRSSQSETKLNALESGSNSGNSKTEVTTSSKNEFWKTLTKNIEDILRDTDKELILRKRESKIKSSSQSSGSASSSALGIISKATSGDGKNASGGKDANSATLNPSAKASDIVANDDDKEVQVLYAAQVISNPESGILQVRATQRQHEKVKEFLDLVISSSQRQVLIEATIAEVQLSQQYEKGIDWGVLGTITEGRSGVLGFGTKFQNNLPLNTGGINTLELGYKRTGDKYNFLSSIRLLEQFGNVKVLSSPKISVLNNQTALLKVTDQHVYFTTTVAVTDATTTTAEKRSYSSTVNQVAVGFVMSVTPYIGNDGTIQLNLRPSISRIVDYAKDPGPALAGYSFENLVPVIRSREIESIMRVANGNIAVLGGLMEDTISKDLGGIPGLTRSNAGAVLANQSESRNKKELVIFIRPRIIKNADLQGDYADFQRYMLDEPAFQAPHPTLEQ